MTNHVFGLAAMAAVCSWSLSSGAFADTSQSRVTAAEIDLLLRGNTIEGTWSGATYKQYFSEDGQTVYLQENRRPDLGRWRVNADTDQYESWWEQTGWTAYTLVKTDEGYAWKREDSLEFFTILQGKQISW